MPGNVAFASIPTVGGHPLVFPKGLCRAFTQARKWEALVNEYCDGTTQRNALVTSERRSWQLTQRLSAADASALWTFVKTYKANAFYFYDATEVGAGSIPGSNYDATGSNATGRYTVRIEGEFRLTIYMARSEAAIQLVEIL